MSGDDFEQALAGYNNTLSRSKERIKGAYMELDVAHQELARALAYYGPQGVTTLGLVDAVDTLDGVLRSLRDAERAIKELEGGP